MNTDNNLSFELGYDIYRFNIAYLLNNADKPVQEGFEAAKLQSVSQVKADKFDRKWLSIRLRCLNRNRVVTVTPDDLKYALEESKGACPVTGETLTFGTGELTDWSIDRIDNDEGYTPTNVIVLSTRANKAKSNFDLTDLILSMVNFSSEEEDRPDNLRLLTVAQWHDMTALFYTKLPLEKHIIYSKEIERRDKSSSFIKVMLVASILLGKSVTPLGRLLIAEKLIKRDELIKIKKIFKKRYLAMGITIGEPPSYTSVISSSEKLTSFILKIFTLISESKHLDRVFIKDIFTSTRVQE